VIQRRPSPAAALATLAAADVTTLRSTARSLLLTIPSNRRIAWIQRFITLCKDHVFKGAPPEGMVLVVTAIVAEARVLSPGCARTASFITNAKAGGEQESIHDADQT
jgi:hypothetical protein